MQQRVKEMDNKREREKTNMETSSKRYNSCVRGVSKEKQQSKKLQKKKKFWTKKKPQILR